MRFGSRRPFLESDLLKICNHKQVPSNSNDNEEVAYRIGAHLRQLRRNTPKAEMYGT